MIKRICILILFIFMAINIKAQNYVCYSSSPINNENGKNVKIILNFTNKYLEIDQKKRNSSDSIKKIDSILVTSINGAKQKLVFYYNPQNKIYSFEFFRVNNNDWTLYSSVRYSYDSLGRIVDYNLDLWADGWFNYIWEKYVYNKEGEKISSLSKLWGANGWENDLSVFTINDSINNIKNQITQKWINGSWINSTKISSDLLQNDTPKIILIETWVNDSWQNDMLQNVEYDNQGAKMSVLTQKWDGNNWANYVNVKFNYGQDKENIQTYQNWENGIWNDVERFIYKTDENNWFLNGIYEMRVNNTWLQSEGHINFVNPDGFELHYMAQTMQVYYSNPLGINNDKNAVINNFELLQNYPNPFNPSTTINFNINHSGNVVLKVYDVLGREVKILVNEYKTAGSYKANFNAAGLPSGVYLYKLTSGNSSKTYKMQLLK